MDNKVIKKTKIGGQAVIEGIMMRGTSEASLAVRHTSGEIKTKKWSIAPTSKVLKGIRKTPILRGCVNLIITFKDGYKCLMQSLELAGFEDDLEAESKFEKWLTKVFGDNLMKFISVIATVLGAALAIGLFMFVPTLIVSLINNMVDLTGYKSIIEGVIKLTIFVGYLSLVSQMKEIRRVFEYHGAEHKTIFCYEYGLDLTVENVKAQKRFHPRCGTSFLIIAVILSIIAFSVVTWDSMLIRVILKIAMLPIVAGFAYEIIMFAGRHENWFTKIISFPGVMLQKITTKEPDDSQIEVAIAALSLVLPKENEDDRW